MTAKKKRGNPSGSKVSAKTRRNSHGLIVVGIGASAGGLEALRDLLAHLDFHDKLTYVVAQHLSPTHTSMLKTLLARESKLNVVELTTTQVPEPNTIYITPPNKDVEIKNGIFHIIAPKTEVGPKPSVNRLFASLAEDQGENAVGVILSGTGADGASGVVAIKSAGGITIVQDPTSAKYDGMPSAAIQTGGVDLVLHPAKIGPALTLFATAGSLESKQDLLNENVDIFQQIVAVTRDISGFDLSHYKTSTIERRIKRRMALHRKNAMHEYLELIREDKDEARQFAQDVLISVTEFFRDPLAFSSLAKVIGKLVVKAPGEEPLRIWVPGCATGEEAYSIAILIQEALHKVNRSRRYQIFATDLDNNATQRGRQGRYPAASLDKVDSAVRERYFEKVGGDYEVVKSLREKIVFSSHNLIQDPPFSHVDLISCRNLLIYFSTPLQKRVLEIFHYALNSDGYLFLGKSETVNQHEDLFQTVNKAARIYLKQSGVKVVRPFGVAPELQTTRTQIRNKLHEAAQNPLQLRMSQAIVQAYGPASIVISGADEVLHSSGDFESFIRLRSGPAGLNIYDLIEEQLRAELRALVYRCRREKMPVFGSRQTVNKGDSVVDIRMAVRPLSQEEPTSNLLISFEKVAAGTSARDAQLSPADRDNPIILELEHELATTREHLQTVVEELETSNEELQSVNEELQSSNEELQSTNEELQTSNEELQSTNEELMTVNDELQIKSHESEVLATDLQNIQDSLEVPLLVVDKQLRISRFVPSIDELVPLSEVHTGDVITSLPWRNEVHQLRHTLNQVIASGTIHHSNYQIGKRIYDVRITPYYIKSGEIGGALLMFYNTTTLHQSKSKLEQSEKRLQSLIDHIVDGVITIDEHGTIMLFSRASERIFGYKAEEVLNKNVSLLMPPAYSAQHQDHINHYLVTGKAKGIGTQREVEGKRKNGETFVMELSVDEMWLDGKRVFTGLMRDITQRREAENALYQEKERALVTLHSIGDAVITTDTHGVVEYMNPVAEALTGWSNGQAQGESLNRVFKLIDETTREPLAAPVHAAMMQNKVVHLVNGTLLINHNSKEFAIEHSASPIRNHSGEVIGSVLVFHDVTEKRSLMRQMAWQARHDPLTGLVNRKEMEVRIEHALTSAKSFNRVHALLYLDLDQFKIVNDTCGHRAGDELLRQLANQVAANLRHRDTLSRLGGDEFGVLLENCDVNQANHIAEKVKQTVQEFRFVWEDKMFKIGVSIGVVEITEKSANLAEIMSDADAACYTAKESGRNRIQVHTPNDLELKIRRNEMHWVSNINKSMDENRFRLYFQLIVPLNRQEAPHWEVLLRMLDNNGDLVLPHIFLSAAERYGLMHNIDRWVLRTTLATLHNLVTSGESVVVPKLAINISGSTLGSESFLTYAQEQFESYKVPPDKLCFEITETTAIANFTKAQKFIREMKKLGCQFALDDFGSGMSSFGYLKSLAVDFLKIDGSFVKDINHDDVDYAMVEAINRIGHLMNISTIAEFVENDQIMVRLNQIGVDYAQGFGVHRPVSLDEFVLAQRSLDTLAYSGLVS